MSKVKFKNTLIGNYLNAINQNNNAAIKKCLGHIEKRECLINIALFLTEYRKFHKNEDFSQQSGVITVEYIK